VNSVKNIIKHSKMMGFMIYICTESARCWSSVRNAKKWYIYGNSM